MGRAKGQAAAELLAFHAAMVRLQQERGTIGQLISIEEWESAMVSTLGTAGVLMTPQSCKDKTWFLEKSRLITRRPRVGVILLNPQGTVNTNAQAQPA